MNYNDVCQQADELCSQGRFVEALTSMINALEVDESTKWLAQSVRTYKLLATVSGGLTLSATKQIIQGVRSYGRTK